MSIKPPLGNFQWVALQSLHWLFLFLAFAVQLQGALAVVKFFTWFIAIVTTTLLSDQADGYAKMLAKRPRSPVRAFVGWAFYFTLLGCLVWFDHPYTAVACSWSILMLSRLQDLVNKERAALAKLAEEQP